MFTESAILCVLGDMKGLRRSTKMLLGKTRKVAQWSPKLGPPWCFRKREITAARYDRPCLTIRPVFDVLWCLQVSWPWAMFFCEIALLQEVKDSIQNEIILQNHALHA